MGPDYGGTVMKKTGEVSYQLLRGVRLRDWRGQNDN
jgi:hypothetical protein